MRYIVFCSNCNFTGSEEETKISSLPKCPECQAGIIYPTVLDCALSPGHTLALD